MKPDWPHTLKLRLSLSTLPSLSSPLMNFSSTKNPIFTFLKHLGVFASLIYNPTIPIKWSSAPILAYFWGIATNTKYIFVKTSTLTVFTSLETFSSSNFDPTSPISSQSSPTTLSSPSNVDSHVPLPTLPTPLPSHPTSTRSRNNVFTPLIRQDNTIHWPTSFQPENHHTTTVHSVPDELTSFTEANKHNDWRLVMSYEFKALLDTHTWDLVPPDPSQNVLGVKWVFHTKRLANGQIERHKVRLVAMGFHRMEGLDFIDTFSPMVKPATVHVLLSLAAMSGWSVCQLDIQNVFLHGDLEETVYV
ncbi:hypothetical protein V2J09_009681 [Rumex salicifolius]